MARLLGRVMLGATPTGLPDLGALTSFLFSRVAFAGLALLAELLVTLLLQPLPIRVHTLMSRVPSVGVVL